jgi:hypothetical protein
MRREAHDREAHEEQTESLVSLEVRQKIITIVGIGTGLWIVWTFVVLSPIVSDLLASTLHLPFYVMNYVTKLLYILGYLLLPIIMILLFLYDIINILRTKDFVFINQGWYLLLSVFSILSIVFDSLLFSRIIATWPSDPIIEKSFAKELNSSNGTASNPNIALQQYATYGGLMLIFVAFLLTGYITFFKEVTAKNKRQVEVASDMFKTIFGFIIGVVAAALKAPQLPGSP